MATVPDLAPVHLLSSSSQHLHIHSHPVTVHPPPPSPSHPDPKPLNPKSVPNLHSTSSDPPPHHPPPPPPPPPLPTPNRSISAAHLQPPPPLLAASTAHSCHLSNSPLPNLLVSSPQGHASSSSPAAPASLLAVAPPPPSALPSSSALNLASDAPSPHPHPASTHGALATPLPPSHITTPSSAAPAPGHGLAPPKSYAQAARSSKGSGFVRSHASDVASFARLPRTGVNIICGSKEGIPSFSFDNSDLLAVENLYSNALIMKFHGGRPSLEASHREIQSWGLESSFSIGPLTSRAFLLRFQDSKDLIRVLSRPSSIIISFPYKVFRWHNLCHQLEDSCFAPVWISLPRLPLQCFIPEFLESVANKIGRFLCLDIATSTLARPSAARLCVEIDLRIPPPPFIWVGLFEGYKQPVIYEKLPKFCKLCIAQGHMTAECPTGQREAIFKQADPLHSSTHGRTPPVRQNATRQLSSNSDHQHAPSAHLHSPTIPPPPPPPPEPAPPDATTHISAPSSATEAVDQPISLHQDSLHTINSATMNIHHRPPPPPNISLDGSSSSSAATQSKDMHVHQPPVKQPSSSPKQQQSVALVQHQASPSQQISSPVAAPPPPNQSSSARPSSVAHHPINSSTTDIHLQAQPSAAMLQRTPAAVVPSTSHASAQTSLILPSAAASSAGSSLQPAAALIQGSFFPSATPPSHSPNPASNPPPSIVPTAVLSFLACANANGHSSQARTPLASSSLAIPSLLSQQYNLEANQAFWNDVNRQLALNEQARHKASTADASFSPSATRSSQNITPSFLTVATQSSPYGDDSSPKSSDAADSQPNSPSSPTLGARNPYATVQKPSYVSEGEELISEPTFFQGHNTDDLLWQRPQTSKRNKRHPDQPLKVQLRARKARNPQPAC